MKTLHFLTLSILFLLIGSCNIYASTSKDTSDVRKTVFEAIAKTAKRSDYLNINLNTRLAFHAGLSHSDAEKAAFKADYLRLQVSGNITEHIYYKWLQHLNRSNTPGNLDNMPSSIDCLGVGFHITPTLSTFIGKQYADYGGFEYDADPAEVYEYSDMGNYITCFLVGANLMWQCTPTQEIRFQVVDGRANSAAEAYGTTPAGFQAAKAPLGYTVNWNGRFLQERLLTRCSFSLFHEGRKDNVCFLAVAAAWMQDNFNMYVDAMYSAEEIDKLGILSEISAAGNNGVRASNSAYLSLVSRINYRPLPKLNLFVKGMYETCSARKAGSNLAEARYRVNYGYQGGIEYFPMKENLRFFAMYRGKHIHYTEHGRALGLADEKPQYLSFGLIYNIPVF